MKFNENLLTTLFSDQDMGLQVLQEYADFWKIAYSIRPINPPNSVLFYHGDFGRHVALDATQPTVVSTSGRRNFDIVAQRLGLDVTRKEVLLQLPVTKETKASIRTVVYEFQGSNLETMVACNGAVVLSRMKGTRTYLLSIDLVSEYVDRLYSKLDDPPSLRFRAAAKLPLSYNTIPSFIRKRAFTSVGSYSEVNPEKLGPIEALRTIFLASLVLASQAAIPRIAFWRRGKTFTAVVTHDVETRVGLEVGASHLLEVEEELGLSSTWDVPSERYHISAGIVSQMAKSGEVCSHDTRHNGRLVFLDFDEKVQRLRKARVDLEKIVGKRVYGFRAPLLQHSRDLVAAVGKAGYEFDSSMPSWEVLSPTSFRPHGVGTVFPFFVQGILEIPVSLPQDHQLLRVGGMSVAEATDLLLKTSEWISGLGGACVLLVHPDYEFAKPEHRGEYLRLVQRFTSDPRCEQMTLGQLAHWWTFRSNSRLEIDHGKVKVIHPETQPDDNGLTVQWVTGYGEDGFLIRDAS